MRSRIETRLHDIGRRLSRALERLTKPALAPQEKLEAAFEVIESYERLSGEVYRLRSARQRVNVKGGEDLLNTAAHEIIGLTPPDRDAESAYSMFIREYRQIWRTHFNLFLFTTCVFAATVIIGWNIGVNQPDYVTLLVGQNMMEKVQSHEAWFEQIQGSPLADGLGIAANNIKVATMGFLLGALFGLGSLYILGYNGLLFGALLGYSRVHGFDDQLIGFVVSHGPLELTIIIASCFAGLLVGRVFYLRPLTLFMSRMRTAGREAGVLALGIIPWLILATTFEAGVSPWPSISVRTKIFSGLLIAGLFWLWTFGGRASTKAVHAKREVRKRA